jgi:hypothetical protein
MGEDSWVVPVVDAADRFAGFVSSHMPTALAGAVRAVGDSAFGPELAVSETESPLQALRLMAHRHACFVAVVDASGTPRGVLRDVDALRAVARTPGRERK